MFSIFLLSMAGVQAAQLCRCRSVGSLCGFFCLFVCMVWFYFFCFVLLSPVGMHAWAGEGQKGGTGKTAADLPASFEKSQINWLSVAAH